MDLLLSISSPFHEEPKFHRSKFEIIILFLFLDLFWGCEATIFYIASKILNLIQDLIFHIWCEHAKIHIISSSQFLPKIPSSFCPDPSSVKEVPLWHFQLSWNFPSTLDSNHHPPQKFSSFGNAKVVLPSQSFLLDRN